MFGKKKPSRKGVCFPKTKEEFPKTREMCKLLKKIDEYNRGIKTFTSVDNQDGYLGQNIVLESFGITKAEVFSVLNNYLIGRRVNAKEELRRLGGE